MLSRVNFIASYFFCLAFLSLFVAASPLPAIVPYTEGVALFKDVLARGGGVVVADRAASVDGLAKREPEAAPDPLPGKETDVEERICRFGCL
ncbi:hypothetical protein EDD16DRAFT_1899407 [Pisolithus croceorrhizus]|nr:hypothetical protein EV401DRAFT_1197496 [Pisolithus croceorrhizus]KAI6106517.1 hypothetical protein EDD16DRAFT_1899407 [Pisolithus croceorrhizus]KAI6163451.1 hypothetical protein EDD17DRAFT_1756463 [Pisolithus thermaeus]